MRTISTSSSYLEARITLALPSSWFFSISQSTKKALSVLLPALSDPSLLLSLHFLFPGPVLALSLDSCSDLLTILPASIPPPMLIHFLYLLLDIFFYLTYGYVTSYIQDCLAFLSWLQKVCSNVPKALSSLISALFPVSFPGAPHIPVATCGLRGCQTFAHLTPFYSCCFHCPLSYCPSSQRPHPTVH